MTRVNNGYVVVKKELLPWTFIYTCIFIGILLKSSKRKKVEKKRQANMLSIVRLVCVIVRVVVGGVNFQMTCRLFKGLFCCGSRLSSASSDQHFFGGTV